MNANHFFVLYLHLQTLTVTGFGMTSRRTNREVDRTAESRSCPTAVPVMYKRNNSEGRWELVVEGWTARAARKRQGCDVIALMIFVSAKRVSAKRRNQPFSWSVATFPVATSRTKWIN